MLLFGNRVALPQTAAAGATLEYPSRPFPSTIAIVTGTLTPSFQAIALDSQLSIKLLTILAKTIYWTRCIDPEPGQGPRQPDQAFLTSFDPQANSAELIRLCRLVDDSRVAERAICKALYIYHANLLGWTCRCSGYRRVVEELGETLRLWQFRELWDRDLWKWLALMTANAARRGKLQHLQTDVMASLLGLENAMQDWKSMQEVTQKFLSHCKLDWEWKLCWDTACGS